MPYANFNTFCHVIEEKETRTKTILSDKNYIDRIKQHYRLFRHVANHKRK